MVLASLFDMDMMDTEKKYASNPVLETVLPDWPGTPLDAQGRFENHEHPFWPKLSDLWRWQTAINPQKEEKKADEWKPEVLPDTAWMDNGRDCLVWLGHSTFLLRLGGKRLLIDPILGDLSFLYRRQVPFPFDAAQLRELDYILLSHDHRDHCDEPSLKQLGALNPRAHILTGLNMATLLRHEMLLPNVIYEAGWFQQYPETDGLRIVFVPSRHWSRRSLLDTNERLWGGFVIEGNGRKLYFGGDSGYGNHFAMVGEAFPDLDVSIIGIGAYKPEWFMGPNHISPADAVTAFMDTGARLMVPMHYGVFDLADEPLSDPYRTLLAQQQQGRIGEQLCMLSINGVLYL